VVDELTKLAIKAFWIAPELQESLLRTHLHTLAERCVPLVARWNDEQPFDDGDWDEEDEDESESEDKDGEAALQPGDICDDNRLEQAMRIEWAQCEGELLCGALLDAFLESFRKHWPLSEAMRVEQTRRMVRHLFHETVRDTGARRRVSVFLGLDDVDESPAV
jgi:hypothetical protein